MKCRGRRNDLAHENHRHWQAVAHSVLARIETRLFIDGRFVAAAQRAFKSGVWSRLAPRQRMEVLYQFAALIEADAERLAVLETLDMGKPIAQVVSGDLPAVISTIRFMAECIDKIEGAVTNNAPHVVYLVLREPLGVVGAISPWNYSLLMAAWKIAPALAAANSVVLKPAEQAPMSCLHLAQLFAEAGGPPGVVECREWPG